jgi:hypothetical protein
MDIVEAIMILIIQKMFDPYEWKPEDYYDKLAVAQKKAHEKAQIERSKVHYLPTHPSSSSSCWV